MMMADSHQLIFGVDLRSNSAPQSKDGTSYPVLNGGSDKRRVPGVSIFPTSIPCSMGSQLELQTEFPNHLIDEYPHE